jgi:hypothetical protein
MPFDPTKLVMTRDGRKARIICTDRRMRNYSQDPKQPLDSQMVVLVTEPDGTETVRVYPPTGRTAGPSTDFLDLINAEHHIVEVQIYRNDNTGEVYAVKKGEFGHHRDGQNRLLATRTIEVTFPATQDEA